VDTRHPFALYFELHHQKGGLMAELIRPAGLPAEIGAYLGPGTKINGKLHFDAPATIEGEVDGEIIAQANITVGQQATVKGKITAVAILVQGKVMADVQAEKRLEVQPPGSVIGDVTTQSLVIGDGAILEGHISMKKSEGRVLPIRQEQKKEGAAS
jgi:cytoskeletal protein CcmA (bactofilin family)